MDPAPDSPPPPDPSELFAAALELPPAERAAFLAAACGDDTTRRARLEHLIAAHERARSFMTSPPETEIGRIAPAAPKSRPDEVPGDRIGRYKLLQKIGEGGCGIVYLAEQQEPVQRRVALKVIKLGMDTREVIARFEAERQALALMEHPNIAKVLDAGAAETGRPFFAMELVRGLPITRYCDENNLAPRARLELFTQVCHAVQHAHQKGIIHRDLKPSNILVTLHEGTAVPKVIDFGIAKATQGRLTDQTLFTAFEQFIGTPAYMSPEQAEMSGLDIDTRSDIYSLGVLLYELLAGRPPFDPKSLLDAGLDEIRRIIREVDPPRPSTRLSTLDDADRATIAKQRATAPAHLSHLLSGDLDWIVMRCLEKDRTRRYETANALALDVNRHLHDEAVVARPPTVPYRIGKFVRRNRLACATGGVVLGSLLTVIVVSTWQSIRATRAERVAIAERAGAEAARLESDRLRLREAGLRASAEASAQQAQVEAARSAAVAQFMKDMLGGVGPAVARGRDTQLLREIAEKTVGRLDTDLADQPAVEADLRSTLGGIYVELGEYDRAIALYERALVLRRQLHGEQHALVASALDQLGDALSRRGRLVDAEKILTQSLERRLALSPADHLSVAAAQFTLGDVLRRQRRYAESERLLRSSLETRRKQLPPDHADTVANLTQLAMPVSDQGRTREAEIMLREALAMGRRLFGNEHPQLASTLTLLGNNLSNQARYADAEAPLVESLAIKEKLLSPGHASIANSLRYLGLVQAHLGRFADAEKSLRRATQIYRQGVGTDHFMAVNLETDLGKILAETGRWREAFAVLTAANELAEKSLPPNDSRSIKVLSELSWVCYRLGRMADTRRILDEVGQRRATIIGGFTSDVSTANHTRAFLAITTGRVEEGLAYFKRNTDDVVARRGAGAALALEWRVRLGLAHLAANQPAETVATLTDVVDALRAEHPVHRFTLATALGALGAARLALRDPQRAETDLRGALAIYENDVPDTWDRYDVQFLLGVAIGSQGRPKETESLLLAGYDGLLKHAGDSPGAIGPARRRQAASQIAEFYRTNGQPDKARDWDAAANHRPQESAHQP